MTDHNPAGGMAPPAGQPVPQPGVQSYACGGCGARVEFAAGTNALRCPYCGHQQQVADTGRRVREHDMRELGRLNRKPVGSVGAYTYVCQQCGARTESNELSGRCQFCAAALVSDPAAVGQIVPEAVLPFAVDRAAMRGALQKWTSSRWFAPGALKKVTEAETTKGTYLPHWTYDAGTVSRYRGQRGTHYYTTESYTDSNGNQQTRRVQHTAWHPVSGEVRRAFDDVLIHGTRQVPTDKLAKLEPWPLAQAVPYQPQFLVGYHTLRYDTEPEQGFESAKGKMAQVIQDDCRRDIGGDEQRVHHVDTQYFNVMYKLMLLPVWIAGYLYAGKSWQVLVNGRTAEVHGERPYSGAKIAAAITAAVLLIAAIITAYVLLKH
jgi:DNA-directed RNA polymerase subunit RPC12/RpoP